MSVYVDNAKNKYGRMVMCHMMADTELDLHVMAQIIGAARKWYQGDHYDICQAKRALAVRYGAKEISSREMVKIRQKNRAPKS